MGKKRPHSDGELPTRDFEEGARKRPKTNRPHKPKPHKADTDSLNAIKKRARTIERLLARDNLNIPANKQNELERELAAHTQRIEDARAKKDRSKMIQKYHMVRFFERKKAMRLAKQLEKKLAQATDPEEVSQLKADLHLAHVDIDYAKYFPFMEPYISLYAGVASGEKDDKNTTAQYLRNPRPPMWSVIEQAREEGQAALEKLQNRRPQKGSGFEASQQPQAEGASAKPPPSAKGANGLSQRGAKVSTKPRLSRVERDVDTANDDESGDSSDGGGFFEKD